jgi:hypothetical protein
MLRGGLWGPWLVCPPDFVVLRRRPLYVPPSFAAALARQQTDVEDDPG